MSDENHTYRRSESWCCVHYPRDSMAQGKRGDIVPRHTSAQEGHCAQVEAGRASGVLSAGM